MTAARKSPDDRKQAILDAALTVFARSGFAAATMDDVAAEAGLSKGGLYWHFRSKDDVLAALLGLLFDQEMQALEALAQAGGSASDRLRTLAAGAAADIQSFAGIHPVALEFYALAARQPDVRRTISDYYRRYHAQLVSLVEQGFAQGEFHSGTSADTAMMLVSLFEGIALVWSLAPDSIDLQVHTATSIDLILKGLQSPPPPTPHP